MTGKKAMNDSEIADYIRRRITKYGRRGIDSAEREILTDRYFGRPYPEDDKDTKNRSKYRTREVMESVEWAMPPFVREFMGAKKVVSFTPTSPEDEPLAKQETEIVNHAIMRSCKSDGFEALYNIIKSVLLYPVAYAMLTAETTKRRRVKNMQGVPTAMVQKLIENGVEILENEVRVVKIPVQTPDQQTGQMMQTMHDVEVVDIKYAEMEEESGMMLYPIPAEDVIVSPELDSLNLDKAEYVIARRVKSRSELISEGYDKKKLDNILNSDSDWWDSTEERESRLYQYTYNSPYEPIDESEGTDDERAVRRYVVNEAYIWIDVERDGEARFRRIVTIGDVVFVNEEVDYQPVVAFSCSLFPHSYKGISPAMYVESTEKLSTELHRQMLNNMYRVNNGRLIVDYTTFVDEDLTIDAIDNHSVGFIPISGEPQRAVAPEPVAPVIQHVLPFLQYLKEEMSVESGVVPPAGIKDQTVQNTPFSSFAGAADRAAERIELYARCFAETGYKRLFRKAHYLCRANPDIVTAFKLRGQWIQPDPASWDDRTDASVNVGLGIASRQQRSILAQQLLQVVQQAIPYGLSDPKGAYAALDELVESFGIGETRDFFLDPNDPQWQPPQPKPDPAEILAQAQAQAYQAQAQLTAAKGQIEQQELVHKAQMDQQELASKMELEQQKLQVNTEQHTDKTNVEVYKAKANVAKIMGDLQVAWAQLALQDDSIDAGKKLAELDKLSAEIDQIHATTATIRKSDKVSTNGSG